MAASTSPTPWAFRACPPPRCCRGPRGPRCIHECMRAPTSSAVAVRSARSCCILTPDPAAMCRRASCAAHVSPRQVHMRLGRSLRSRGTYHAERHRSLAGSRSGADEHQLAGQRAALSEHVVEVAEPGGVPAWRLARVSAAEGVPNLPDGRRDRLAHRDHVPSVPACGELADDRRDEVAG